MRAFATIFTVAFFCYSCSCSREEAVIGPTTLMRIAQEFDSSVSLVPVPNDEPRRRILCRSYAAYGEGCVPGYGMRLKVRGLEMIVVRFDSVRSAAIVAKRLDQWYFQNWLLDDVTGESVLEDFVSRAYSAKRGRDWVDDQKRRRLKSK